MPVKRYPVLSVMTIEEMGVDEPVEEWMRKPKTGICKMCMHLCACAYFSIFLKCFNSRQKGNPSRLPSQLGSECDRLILSSVWLTASSCHNSTQDDSWADEKCKLVCVHCGLWKSFLFFFFFLLHNGAETVLIFDVTKSQSWSTMEADCCWCLNLIGWNGRGRI